jgi:AcrR family transcriptional regulator
VTTSAGRRRPARRPPVTRDRIVTAAIALGDEGGTTAITMRALGRAVGVEAMSLYHHVRGREDVLDGVVDRIHEQFHDPDPDRPWKDELRRRSHVARDVVRRHPWVLPLLNSRQSPGAPTLRHVDAVLGLLRAAGFSLPMAAHTFALVDSHLYGFLTQEVALPFTDGPGVEQIAATIEATTGMADFPHLAHFVAGHALQPGYDFADEFDWGLEVVLDAVERELRAETEHG